MPYNPLSFSISQDIQGDNTTTASSVLKGSDSSPGLSSDFSSVADPSSDSSPNSESSPNSSPDSNSSSYFSPDPNPSPPARAAAARAPVQRPHRPHRPRHATNITAITSVALGSCIIEKHFTLDRNGGGPDDSFSLEPADLKSLCDSVRNAWQCLGDADYSCQSSESANIKFRRSLYFVKDLNAGDIITAKDIRSVRPGYGMAPKHFEHVIGQRVIKRIEKNSPVQPSVLTNA